MDTESIHTRLAGDGSSLPPVSSGAERESTAAEASVPDRLTEIRRRAEAEGMTEVYPDFDPEAALAHPLLGAWLRGEAQPDLRCLYEAAHAEEIVASRVQSRLDAAVAEALATALPRAVAAAVAESEERLLGHIRARGQRPAENGTSASVGIRIHPAVDRLSRRDRARLAERAERGEIVSL